MERPSNSKPIWESPKLQCMLTIVVIAIVICQFRLRPIPPLVTGPIDTLGIGSKVPAIPLSYIDSAEKPGNLQDYRGKLVIMAFFSMTCTPCVYQFPKLDDLQKEFSRDVKFIPMIAAYSTDEEKEVRAFYHKWGYPYKAIRAGFALENIITVRCFPKEILPLYVWISPDGKILNITSFEKVTGKNIRSILDKYCLPFSCYRGVGVFL